MHPTLFPLEPLTVAVPTVPGLRYVPDYIGPWEQREILSTVDAGRWETQFERRIQGYGYRYLRGMSAADTPEYVGPLPDWAASLSHRLRDDGLTGRVPDQLLVNEYEPGQGIAPHIDYAPFDRTVVSISLGSACLMDIIHTQTGERHEILLEPGSALVLQDEARYLWKHGIARRRSDVIAGQVVPRGRRVSLTFRNVLEPVAKPSLVLYRRRGPLGRRI
jgi:alkylated DNA repair dioxygenase AlkB